MRLQTRIAALERRASRPAPDYRGILMGVAEQVPAADRDLILSTITAWETGDEAQMHRFVRDIGDEALELVCSAFDRAGLVARGDAGLVASILDRMTSDTALTAEDRATAKRLGGDVRGGKVHHDDVLPRLNDELLTAFERALHHPKSLSDAMRSEA